jgi:glycosyltransferase involved in cell wall biosynthesis
VGAGAQSELVQYYNAADALVLASSREGMANVLLEALACGTPVVVTPVGGNPEVVADAAAGIVLPERSAQAVADGIGQVLFAPPTREDTRKYAETFSWADVAKRLYQLMSDVRSAHA